MRLNGVQLQLAQLSTWSCAQLSAGFSQLKPNQYADGNTRYRHYSRFMLADVFVERIDTEAFCQSKQWNQFQGDVSRVYDPIPSQVSHSKAFYELLSKFVHAGGIAETQPIDVHQFRIQVPDEGCLPAPEGIHQDGYDWIAMACIARHNIQGGALEISLNRTSDPFLQLDLEPGQILMLDDATFWHNAQPILPIVKHSDAHWDLFVCTSKCAQ